MDDVRLQTRATSTTSGIQLQVSGELMDDYVFATDLTQASEISIARGADGSSRLFYQAQSGIMSLFQDPGSDTGWTEEAVGQPQNGLREVRGARIADGTILAFGIGINQSAPDLYIARKPPGGSWSGWSRITVSDAVPRFTYATAIDLVVTGGAATLFALLRPTPGHRARSAGLWRVDWQAADPVWTRIADSDQRVMETCTVPGAGTGLLFAQRSSANPNLVDLFHFPAPYTGSPKLLSAGISYTDLAVGTGDGRSFIVIADDGRSSGSTAISVLDCAHPATGFVTVDKTLTATSIVVADDGATPMAIFALDEKNRLNLIDRGGASAWLPPFNLQLVCSTLAAVAGPQGQSELYAWLPGKGLYRKWRSPVVPGDDTPGPGPWSEEPVRYRAVNSRMVQQRTYATTIAVYDANGAPMTNRDVNLRASQFVSATAAGEVVLLGPDQDTMVGTDATGRIRLTAPASSLATCEFSVSLPGIMDAEEDFKIQPNAKVQQRLAGLSEAELKTLLNPKFGDTAGQVHQAIQAAMAPMKPIDGYRTVRHRPAGRHGHRTPLDTTGMQAFRLDVGPAGARFLPLTAAEADSARAEIALGGLFEFFEDVIDALSHAIETVVDFVGTFVVKPIAGAINIALEFVVDGIRYATEALIDAVEQAFQAVDAVFDMVLTPFTALYDFFAWLLKDASADIWKTKAYFQEQLRSSVSQLATLAGQGAAAGGTFFATVKTEIERRFDEIEKKLTGANLNTGLQAGPPGGRAIGDGGDTFMDMIDGLGAASAWLRDKIYDALFGTGSAIDLPEKMIAQFTAFMTEVNDAIGDSVAQAIDAFLASFQEFASNSSSFAGMALATLIEAVKQAILLVLGVLDQILQKFLQLISANLVPAMDAILGAAVANPLVQAVYDLINPGPREPVTAERILCLICAFPATILYRGVTGSVPFPGPDRADAAQVKSVLMIVSGCVAVPWWGVDLAADMGWGNAEMVLFGLVVVPALMNILACPAEAIPPKNPLDQLRLASWGMSFGGPACVFCWAMWKDFKQGPRAVIQGQLVLSAIALATLGVNLAQIVIDGDLAIEDYIILIAGPISGLAKPLRGLALEKRYPQALIVLGIADTLSDLSLGGARIKKGIA
jgi:hypothetical protein